MPREISTKCLKKKAWKLFSEFIRRRYANKDGFNVCITCGKKEHWKNMDAGHFIAGRTNSVLFDEDGVYAQCVYCNKYKHGAVLEYRDFMVKKFGEAKVEEMRVLARKIVKYNREDYLNLIAHYSKKLKEIE